MLLTYLLRLANTIVLTLNYCNKHLSGNLIEYRKGLIKRFDLAFVEQLESESDERRNYKYSKNELIAKKLQYEIKIKELNN